MIIEFPTNGDVFMKVTDSSLLQRSRAEQYTTAEIMNEFALSRYTTRNTFADRLRCRVSRSRNSLILSSRVK